MYNARFDIAFSALRLKKWPYENPIVIAEGDEDTNAKFVLNKWCLFELDDDGNLVARDERFDLDLYKILKSYLLNPKNHKHIKQYQLAV